MANLGFEEGGLLAILIHHATTGLPDNCNNSLFAESAYRAPPPSLFSLNQSWSALSEDLDYQVSWVVSINGNLVNPSGSTTATEATLFNIVAHSLKGHFVE